MIQFNKSVCRDSDVASRRVAGDQWHRRLRVLHHDAA